MTASLCFETLGPDVRVIPLGELPAPAAGDPGPQLSADEHHVRLTYQAEDASRVEVRFDGWDVSFGSPNDEALCGHPLYARGVGYYGVFEVLHSPWIAALERANRVHSQHDPSRFADLRHIVITFHDSTFECVTRGFTCASA